MGDCASVRELESFTEKIATKVREKGQENFFRLNGIVRRGVELFNLRLLSDN